MNDLTDVAHVLLAISAGFGLAALAHYVADKRERRKWRRASRRIPFIKE